MVAKSTRNQAKNRNRLNEHVTRQRAAALAAELDVDLRSHGVCPFVAFELEDGASGASPVRSHDGSQFLGRGSRRLGPDVARRALRRLPSADEGLRELARLALLTAD